jgi:C-terminal processing protease CtpA/Prc
LSKEAVMKRIGSALLLILVIAGMSAGTPAIAAQDDPAGKVPSGERLAGLCRLWGVVKFCHPYLATREIDWDTALIRTLPMVRDAKTPEEYKSALQSLLAYLNDPATGVDQGPGPGQEPSAAEPSAPGKPQPYVERTEDGISVLVASDYGQFADGKVSWAKLFTDFQAAFAEAAKSSKVVIDLRNLSGAPVSFTMSMAFSRNFPAILAREVILPPTRFLSHEGYPSQRESTYAYHSDLSIRSGGVLRPVNPEGPKPETLVFLLNRNSADLSLLLTALQDRGLATVIQEGDLDPGLGIPSIPLDLPDSLKAHVRCAEILRKDGDFDYRPDLVVESDARETALEFLRGRKKIVQPGRPPGAGGSSFHGFSVAERAYPEMTYPDRDYRLLALFRFWNIIDRFYPYKELLDQAWDKTLLEFIPRMEAAKDASGYVMTVAELLTRIQDSHGTISSPLYSQYLGTNFSGIVISFIEGRSVVVKVPDPLARERGIEAGDVVISVDGEKAEDRRARLKKVIAASTTGRLEAIVDMRFLAGNKENPSIKLAVRKASGKVMDVELPRTPPQAGAAPEAPKLPNFGVLPSGFGYIDLGRLLDSDVGLALEAVKKTPGLILDMRGYPIGGTWLLAGRLATSRKSFAILEFPMYSGEAGIFSRRRELQDLEPNPEHFDYKGKIAVLIHGSTQSAAEHTCLLLETVADVTFVGSPTSGADGNITYTFLPGNIALSFTGMGVLHADGRQLQRKGIQPHIRVEPTIKGIRSGRDEILEKAVEFLKKRRG